MKKFFVLTVVSFFCVNILFAQNVKYYEGAMRIPADILPLCNVLNVEEDDNGEYTQGKYAYYNDVDGNRVWHGEFSITTKYENESDIPVVITGRYSHGKKTGKWTVSIKGNVPELEISQRLELEYKHDRLSGRYLYTESWMDFDDKYNKYKITESYSGTIVKGQIQGKVTWKRTEGKENYELSGMVDSKGVPTGIWTLTNNNRIKMIQNRLYLDGALVSIEEVDNSTGVRNLSYCAFEGITKAPKKEDISFFIDAYAEEESIAYNDSEAVIGYDDAGYNSDIKYGDRGSWGYIPASIIELDSNLSLQVERWKYKYGKYIVTEIVVVDNEAEITNELEVVVDETPVTWVNAYSEEEEVEEEFYYFVEEEASFPGGDIALKEYIKRNLKYPELARENNITGKVIISFAVEKDGSITNAEILREIGGGCGEEALRVVNSMPKWNPGKQAGRPVRSKFSMPVQFVLL